MLTLLFRPLVWLVEFTIIIGLAGGLVDLTRDMEKAAVHAHQTGLISLHQLNEQLVGK